MKERIIACIDGFNLYFGLKSIWEVINNLNFKRIEFDAFNNEAELNNFSLTPQKWISTTNAILKALTLY